MRTANPDIVYCSNNGVLAMKPTETGRLRSLVTITMTRISRMWIFSDVGGYIDDYCEELIDHHRRGIICGSYADGSRFLDRCRELGFAVECAGFFVPCSNGERRHGTDGNGQPMADFDAKELSMIRVDLPTFDDLVTYATATR